MMTLAYAVGRDRCVLPDSGVPWEVQHLALSAARTTTAGQLVAMVGIFVPTRDEYLEYRICEDWSGHIPSLGQG
jgi:hypothetical protein